MKSLLRILALTLTAYVIVVAGLYVFQRHLLFLPNTLSDSPSDWQAPDMKAVSLQTADGLTLKAWYKAPSKPSMPTLIYFHGNHGHIGQRVYKARSYMDAGYGVLLPEYRGYGGNLGSPSEDGLYLDAQAAVSFLEAQSVHPEQMILYGESLGTGVAVHTAWELAKTHQLLAVVLEAPYTSIPDAGAYRYPFLPIRWLTWDRFDSLSRIADIQAPLLIVHGTADTIVPFPLGEKLFNAAQSPKKSLFVDGAGHNNLYQYGVAKGILDFLAEVAKK